MTLTNVSKTSTTLTNTAKTSTAFDNGVGYLLKEDTFYLLLETGDKIILNQSWNDKYVPVFTNISKN